MLESITQLFDLSHSLVSHSFTSFSMSKQPLIMGHKPADDGFAPWWKITDATQVKFKSSYETQPTEGKDCAGPCSPTTHIPKA